MPASSMTEKILAALCTRLKDRIVGRPDYFHLLEATGRPPTWAQFDAEFYPDDVQTFMMVRPGLESFAEQPGQQFDGQLEVWLLAGTKHNPDSYSPWSSVQQDTPTQRAQQELAVDFKKALLAEFNLGGLQGVENVEIRHIDYTIHLEGWVIVEFFLVVSYNALSSAP